MKDKWGLLKMLNQFIVLTATAPVQQITLPQAIISALLFLVIFFGIGFLLNMLLRMTWLMAVAYPIVMILIIDNVKFYEYITKPAYAFSTLGQKLASLSVVDIVIFSSGLLGAIISGVVMKLLRKAGYQMF